jgi:hypothetical protein
MNIVKPIIVFVRAGIRKLHGTPERQRPQIGQREIPTDLPSKSHRRRQPTTTRRRYDKREGRSKTQNLHHLGSAGRTNHNRSLLTSELRKPHENRCTEAHKVRPPPSSQFTPLTRGQICTGRRAKWDEQNQRRGPGFLSSRVFRSVFRSWSENVSGSRATLFDEKDRPQHRLCFSVLNVFSCISFGS